jgi:hypothetical protein
MRYTKQDGTYVIIYFTISLSGKNTDFRTQWIIHKHINFKQNVMFCEIWGAYSGVVEDNILLARGIVSLGL